MDNAGVIVVLSAAGGVVTYAWQERAKLRVERYEKMSALYQKIIDSLFRLFLADLGEEKSGLLTVMEGARLDA